MQIRVLFKKEQHLIQNVRQADISQVISKQQYKGKLKKKSVHDKNLGVY